MPFLYFLILVLITFAIFANLLHGKKLIIARNNETNKYKLLFLTVPPLLFGFYFIALRPLDAGGDTQAYINTFLQLDSIVTAHSVGENTYGNTEYLFWPTQALIKYFFDVRGWLIVNYLIVTALICYAYKKILSDTKISYLIFGMVYLTFYAVYTGNVMRQAYAIPLGALAFYYASTGNNKKHLIFLLLAICFHWSAIALALSKLTKKIPNKRLYYLSIPAAALLFSAFMAPLAGYVASVTKFSFLASKYNLYFAGRTTHFGQVWETANFWICVFVYSTVVFIAPQSRKTETITKYMLLFMTLMLFSINIPNVSERYMGYFLFLIPISIATVLLNTKAPAVLKNVLFTCFFVLMAILVYTRDSARITLGIS